MRKTPINPIDIHVGKQLKLRRKQLGMTQTELGKAINRKFGQIQKFEYGSNRIAASHLWWLSKALNVEIAWFFKGLEK